MIESWPATLQYRFANGPAMPAPYPECATALSRFYMQGSKPRQSRVS